MIIADEGTSINGNLVTISATTTLTTEVCVYVTNGGTNITITFPSPVTNPQREIRVCRGTGSTGSITLNPGAGQIEALNATLGATTTLANNNNYGAKCIFKSNGTNWVRIQNS